MEPRRAHVKAEDADIYAGLEQDGAHGARCVDPDQERGGPNVDLPTQLSRGHLR